MTPLHNIQRTLALPLTTGVDLGVETGVETVRKNIFPGKYNTTAFPFLLDQGLKKIALPDFHVYVMNQQSCYCRITIQWSRKVKNIGGGR